MTQSPGHEFLGYYPGCSGQGTSKEYDDSTRIVCKHLGLPLVDLRDWNCCGSTPAHTMGTSLSAALAGRNLALAGEQGLKDVVTPCPSCLKNLKNSIAFIQEDAGKKKVEHLMERSIGKEYTARSILEVLVTNIGLDKIKATVKKPLKGLKVVPYYGCMMNRPAETMQFDDPEYPMALDNLLEALGAEVLPFPLKVECCGAAFAIPSNKAVTRLSGRIIDMATSLGADCIVVACPLCQMNLDLRQGQINRANKQEYSMPIAYFTQLMGIAFGMTAKELGFGKLVVNPAPMLERAFTKPDTAGGTA